MSIHTDRRQHDQAALETARYVLAHPELYADQPAYAETLRRLAEERLKREGEPHES